MSKRRRKRPPQEPVTLEIKRLSHDGRGIAELDGKVTFVRNALPGETVQAKLTCCRSQYNDAESIEILTASPARVTPRCPHFGLCGGCQLQHMSHADQISYKQEVFKDMLQQAGLTPQQWLEPLVAEPWQYRHKARIGAKFVDGKERVLIGFRETNGRYIADLHQCPILPSSVGEKFDTLAELVRGLSIFREIPQFEVAIDDNTTALIIRHLSPFTEDDLTRLRQFAKDNQWQLYLQPKGPDSIKLFYPEDADPLLHYDLPGDIHMDFAPEQFTQINPAINQLMVTQALELLALQADDQLLDLFCGIGNFSLAAASKIQHVVGVEGDTQAVERAKQNASNNNISNAEFHVANLFEDSTHYPWAKLHYSKILIDPPRSGAELICSSITAWQAERVVYVSCNASTLVRDAAILKEQGYHLLSAGIMDMFPHTKHFECIALLCPS